MRRMEEGCLMGWIRISDDFYDHPKFTDITPLSIALWIVGMGYCNRNLTDGYVPTSVAQRLCDFEGLSYTVAEGEFFSMGEDDCTPLAVGDLLAVGLWHEDGHDCPDCPQPGRRRYYVHDYLVYQPSAAEIQAQREAKSAAGKKGADSRWHGRSHSTSHNSSDGTTDGKTMPPTPTPHPTPVSPNGDTALSRKRESQTPDRFEEFWDTYSHKVGRAKAEKAYRVALKKPGVTADLLIASAAAYITWQMGEGKHPEFTKHPTTWLHGEHWRDERPARRPAPQTNMQAHMALVEELGREEHSNVSPFRQLGGGR